MSTKPEVTVYVPGDSSAVAVGADEVAAALADHVGVEIVRNGSRGMLWLEPLVEVATPGVWPERSTSSAGSQAGSTVGTSLVASASCHWPRSFNR